jgi:hypothetical protein
LDLPTAKVGYWLEAQAGLDASIGTHACVDWRIATTNSHKKRAAAAALPNHRLPLLAKHRLLVCAIRPIAVTKGAFAVAARLSNFHMTQRELL